MSSVLELRSPRREDVPAIAEAGHRFGLQDETAQDVEMWFDLPSIDMERNARVAVEKAPTAVRAARERVVAHPGTTWIAAHRSAVQWSIVVFGGLVLVAWSNPTAGVVLVDAALIGVAVWLVAALARSGSRPAS